MEETKCSCHCHHTAVGFGEPGYLNQPNWAECPLACDSECEHCKVGVSSTAIKKDKTLHPKNEQT